MAKEKMKKEEKPEMSAVVETRTIETAPASIYTIDELTANYQAFGTYREIVAVALRLAGKNRLTILEARKIVEAFKNKEVK